MTSDIRELRRKLEAEKRKTRRLEIAASPEERLDYPGRGTLICAVCKQPTTDHPVAVLCGKDWIQPKEKS